MKKVTKVLMFVWRKKGNRKEFFVLHRKRGDCVVLTGHVGDSIPDETFKQAVRREIKEELGIGPRTINDLDFKVTVKIKEDKELSTEHAFLVEIPSNKEVKFLEGDEKHHWYPLEKLFEVLTYPNQKAPLGRIKKLISEEK